MANKTLFQSATGTTFAESQSDSFTVCAPGGPDTTLAVAGTLPSGVSFSDNGDGTATLSGTATQTGDFPGIPATGKAADIPCLSVDEIRDGRIQRHADYWSLATYLQQVGLMPTPEP